MTRCTHCKRPIEGVPAYLVRQTAKQTHWSPAEYDEEPFHVHCADLVTSDEYAAYCDEMESLRGLSPEERERI